MHQPLDPSAALDKIPGLIRGQLVSAITTAYSVSDDIIESYPILQSPHLTSALGQLRYFLVDNVVKTWVSEGLIQGHAEWRGIPHSGAHYLEYQWENTKITFSSAGRVYTLPRNSDFRENRAFSNQLLLFSDFPASQFGEVPSLLMTHGYRELCFVQLVLPSHDDGKIVGLAWSENLLNQSGQEGLGGNSSYPTDPVPSEHVAELLPKLKESAFKRLLEIENQ